MRDMQAQPKKLREAAKCATIRDLATNPQKRELFANLARQLDNLADAVERATANGAGDTFLGRKSYAFAQKGSCEAASVSGAAAKRRARHNGTGC